MATEYKINVPLNLVGNELRNALFQTLAVAPTGTEALFYYDSTSHAPFFYNGTSWVVMDATKATNIPNSALATNPLDRANHTGTQGWTTITATPTTLAGYGIVDAVPVTRTVSTTAPLVGGGALSGNLTLSISAATTSAAGTMSSTDKAKLDGIASGATANSTDAFLLSRTNHTGTQLSATISDLATTVKAYTLNSFAAPTVDVSLNSHKITNLATPTLSTDAATKAYVDAQAQTAASGIDPKEAVKAATTANITLSGTQTVDGVSLVAGDRVLVKNQTTASANGIYAVSASGWTRTADASQGTLTSGAMTLVLGGTANGGSQWYMTTADPITVGTTSLTFVQFGASSIYSFGNGFTVVGQNISVDPSVGIVVNGAGVGVDTTVVAMKYATTLATSATSYTVTHNLGTKDVIVSVQNVSTGDIEYAYINAATTNTVTVSFSVAPAANAYRVTVHG